MAGKKFPQGLRGEEIAAVRGSCRWLLVAFLARREPHPPFLAHDKACALLVGDYFLTRDLAMKRRLAGRSARRRVK